MEWHEGLKHERLGGKNKCKGNLLNLWVNVFRKSNLKIGSVWFERLQLMSKSSTQIIYQ